MERSKTYIAIPPGATIKEQLLDRCMNQKEFACRMEMSEKHISKLINGEVQLTMETAIKLEMVLGLPAQFWCNLETIYREKLIKVVEENTMDIDIQIAKKIPYKEMEKNGWIETSSNWYERVIVLRKYFEVVKLELLEKSLLPIISCRKLSISEKSDFALMAWAQKAKIEARDVEVKSININKLKTHLSELRKMTMDDPNDFCPILIERLADCGIATVFLPHIGGSFLHGATFLDNKKIVLGLTVRGKDADKFWFSLFHEIAHIIYGHVTEFKITSNEDERDADEFAKNTLIPYEQYQIFVNNNNFNKDALIEFAKDVGIDVGILVGRLQKEKYIEYSWYNDLKKKYRIG